MNLRRGLVLLAGAALAVSTLAAFMLLSSSQRSTTPTETPLAPAEVDIASLISNLTDAPGTVTDGPWDLSLPGDHGAHPNAPTETWGLTAHLEGPDGSIMGLSFTLTRVGPERQVSEPGGVWGPAPIYFAQAVLTGHAPEFPVTTEMVSRAAGTAGHDASAQTLWIDDWSLSYGGSGLELSLMAGDQPINLSMQPQSVPVSLNGVEAATTRGFIIPQLSVSGTLGAGSDATTLSGTAWLDRAWGDVAFPGGPLIRDRLVTHLSDGSAISILRTRREDGRGIAIIDGLTVSADGVTNALDENELGLSISESENGASVIWDLHGPGLTLRAEAVADAIVTNPLAAGQIHLLTVEGSSEGQPVTGVGTLFLSVSDPS